VAARARWRDTGHRCRSSSTRVNTAASCWMRHHTSCGTAQGLVLTGAIRGGGALLASCTPARPHLNHGVSHGIGVALVGCISDELGAKTLFLRGSV
jgi:hypothetical protein